MKIRIRICQVKVSLVSLRPLLSKTGFRAGNLNEGQCQFMKNTILKKTEPLRKFT